MKTSKNQWYPTKYQLVAGRWRGNRNNPFGSRIVEDLQAEAYQRALESHARGRLADLGCGNAPLAGIYAPYVSDYVWADWPVSSASQIFKLDYEVDLSGPLPFATSEFDTVVLSDVLEHISEPDILMAEMSRITRAEGKIIVGVPFMYGVHEKPHDYHRYTRYKLEQFAEKHGLEVVSISEVGGALEVWFDLSAKLCQFLWSPLAIFPYTLYRCVRWLPIVIKLNQKASWKFPLAYLAIFKKPTSD